MRKESAAADAGSRRGPSLLDRDVMNLPARLPFARAVCACLLLAGVAAAPAAPAAAVDLTPFVTVEPTALFPLSSARASMKPGGGLRFDGGLRHALGSAYAVSLVGDGGLLLFAAHCGANAPRCTDDDAATVLSLTAGPRLSLLDGGFELFFGVRGGVFRAVSAGLGDTAGGWGLDSGVGFELVPGTTAGLRLRYDRAGIDVNRAGGDLEALSVGLGFEHRFAAPPVAVAQPRPRPDF